MTNNDSHIITAGPFSKKLANFSQLYMARYIAFTLIFLSALLLGYSSHVHAQTSDHSNLKTPSKAPIVVELFTSAGCPQCPRADTNFNNLTTRTDVITLACHVTYFDSRRRPDPHSQPFCDARQSIYKMALGTGKIFTPMMIINGQDYLTGMSTSELNQALIKSHKNNTSRPVGLAWEGGYINIKLPAAEAPHGTELWLIEYRPKAEQNYLNAVTNITKLMNWDGSAANLAFPANPESTYAVIGQSYKQGIIAAGKIEPAL